MDQEDEEIDILNADDSENEDFPEGRGGHSYSSSRVKIKSPKAIKAKEKSSRAHYKKQWAVEEKGKFLQAMELYGKKWKMISQFVGTKSPSQVQSYFYNASKGGEKPKEEAAEGHVVLEETIVRLENIEDDEDICVDDDNLDPHPSTDETDLKISKEKSSTSSSPHPPVENQWAQTKIVVSLPYNVSAEKYTEIKEFVLSTWPLQTRFSNDSFAATLSQEFSDLSKADHTLILSCIEKELASNEDYTSALKVGKNEGCTLQHNQNGSVITKTIVTLAKRKKGIEPFNLVPCQDYKEKAPLTVQVDVSAFVLMNVHTYAMKTEVIGLLGGLSMAKEIQVWMAVPCHSNSTDIQCEMDPVSQSVATEKIHDRGLQVVGWYHSHPNFATQPSQRDIETQADFQHMFSQQDSSQAFIGLILGRVESCQAFHVTRRVPPTPFSLPLVINNSSNTSPDDLASELKSLGESVQHHPDRLYIRPCIIPQSFACISEVTDVLEKAFKEAALQFPEPYLERIKKALNKCKQCK